jgi:cytidylate kinase
MSNRLTIAISGKSGCGNTVVSNMVAEKLGLRHINYTFHNIAAENGVSFEEIMDKAEMDNRYDLYLDKKQVQLADGGGCVLGSRLAIWLLKHAEIKVYLEASLRVRAARIARRENKDFSTAYKETNERDRKDHNRFYRLYAIDNTLYDFADLIVDTEEGDQYYVTHTIIDYIRKRGFID